ncbi:hypothetical protein LTR37_001338 [Vermiconidia calcicola]|uniref:Uncharacterized protein n=1 Tax=Vermiconidia calcicola TaxID=1690605 RepID=A0ACC3NWS2_9PEZI|nr:hypothetical protein LTR37_001338 [Vermiconidia calcicola]
MSGRSPAPDLQAILSTLAQYVQPFQPGTFEETAQTSTPTNKGQAHSEAAQPIAPPQPLIERADDARLRPQSRSTASPKPIDPATITTWQDGLRCVTKVAAQNAQFAATIRRMMSDQRKNELRWYSERQSLKNTQANRANSSAKAASILQSLGGGGFSGSHGAVDQEAELAAFDRKIYAAQEGMETAMTAELKGLGVPFFGTDRDLVLMDDAQAPSEPSLRNQPRWSPFVTEEQLLELRRRMVGYLEDLYRD